LKKQNILTTTSSQLFQPHICLFTETQNLMVKVTA